jgi:hypothetical protein
VLEAEYGWQVFGVEERLPAAEPTFTQAMEEVRRARCTRPRTACWPHW